MTNETLAKRFGLELGLKMFIHTNIDSDLYSFDNCTYKELRIITECLKNLGYMCKAGTTSFEFAHGITLYINRKCFWYHIDENFYDDSNKMPEYLLDYKLEENSND